MFGSKLGLQGLLGRIPSRHDVRQEAPARVRQADMACAAALGGECLDPASTFQRSDIADHGGALGAHPGRKVRDRNVFQIIELHQQGGLSGRNAGAIQISPIVAGQRAIGGAGRLGHADMRAVAEILQQEDPV